MIEIGSEVQDVITGFKGIVTGRVEYITGCNQVLVAPKAAKDGSMRDSTWIDEQRVKVTKKAKTFFDNGKTPGFDKQPPVR